MNKKRESRRQKEKIVWEDDKKTDKRSHRQGLLKSVYAKT